MHGDHIFLIYICMISIVVMSCKSDPDCTMQPRVLKFDSNDNFITKFGSYGIGQGQIKDPEHLSGDSEGNVYVSDRKNDNIQVFTPINKTMG